MIQYIYASYVYETICTLNNNKNKNDVSDITEKEYEFFHEHFEFLQVKVDKTVDIKCIHTVLLIFSFVYVFFFLYKNTVYPF